MGKGKVLQEASRELGVVDREARGGAAPMGWRWAAGRITVVAPPDGDGTSTFSYWK